VVAKVVALDQAFYVNRFGTLQAGGMVFALERDVVSMDGSKDLRPGRVMIRPDKRPRPMTLRVNRGQCLEIQFQNLLSPMPVSQRMDQFPPDTKVQDQGSIPTLPPGGYKPNQQVLVPSSDMAPDRNGDQRQPPTRYAGVHVAGLEWVSANSGGAKIDASSADGTFAGANDVAANDLGGTERVNGLVPPGKRITYVLYAAEEGAFLLSSGAATVGERLAFGGQLSEGLFGSVMVEPPQAEYYRSQVGRAELDAATVRANALPERWTLGPPGPECRDAKGDRRILRVLRRNPTDPRNPNRGTSCVKITDEGALNTLGDQPIINYDAVFGSRTRRASAPVLSMLEGKRGDSRRELVASDLTAIITGPFASAFGAASAQTPNETYPEAQQPYREFAIHYHDDFMATQAFAAFRSGDMQFTLQGGRDFFAINYGMGGIGATLWANRLQIGPASDCATCKFEEFFLSSWPNGDPAMVVDQSVNVVEQTHPPQTSATKAFYPDDPSNVYHSYLRDHVKFRIVHAGANITHVHHQHAHQWLHSPKSGLSAYRDSQMISPGAAYTLDMVYGGSGNKNLTVGDSIFHCHFYPHFAQGMWALWRVHDVFEAGTRVGANGEVLQDGPNRALPDGEIAFGTPIPGLVPLPTLAMAPVPARVEIKSVALMAPDGKTKVDRYEVVVNPDDLKAGLQPGYPFYIPGIAGQRAPHPPMSYAPQLDDSGSQVESAGDKQRLDGGLPRNIVIAELGSPYENHNRWDFSKDTDQLFARELEEEGTVAERAAMMAYGTRNHQSYTPVGAPATFVYNGQPAVRGAPFANPAVQYNGDPVKVCEPADPNCNGMDYEGRKLIYKSADIQTDVALNKKGWHYPQQRMSVLWQDAKPTLDGKKRPEPLFIRANSGDVIEFWLTNLIPSYYDLDDFQVRTPTDIVGQHIHLVKFDVLASDGAANGFNYESGTLAAEEVRSLIGAINKAGGLVRPDKTVKLLTAKSIPEFEKQFKKGDPLILGAQATVELWYVDPLTSLCRSFDQKDVCPKDGVDRTMGTVFTHDHFGPSTHQQAGLYAGLVIEPRNSQWLTATTLAPMGGTDPKTGKPIATRPDGGPTSWAAVIDDGTKRHREFVLEFQDRQLAYSAGSTAQPKLYQRYQPATAGLVSRASPNGPSGWTDSAAVINAPAGGGEFEPDPQLVTNSFGSGAWSLNYRNEPLALRLVPGNRPNATDTAFAFASIPRNDAAFNIQPSGPIDPCAGVKADVTVLGDLVPGPTWTLNGKPLPNNGTVELRAGQVVCFAVKAGTHGLLFPAQTIGESVFDIAGSPQKDKFKLNPNPGVTCSTASSYGTTPQSSGVIAVLRVRSDVTLTQPAPFECSQHCANMAGSFTLDDTLSIAGDQDANNNHFWVVNGKPLKNGDTVLLKRGQLVRFTVKAGTHGLLFKNQAAAQAVFDIAGSPQASKFRADPLGASTCNLPNTFGTVPQAAVANPTSGQNTIAELRVLADARISGGLDFLCSQHCANMAGSFAFDPVLEIVGSQDRNNNHFWTLNGKTMPNGESLELRAGQRVRFTVRQGTHGLLFADKVTAEAIFDIPASRASKFVPNPRGNNTCGLANSYGTVPQSAVANPGPGDNTIAELVVKQSFTLPEPGQWMSSQHCQSMQGLFVPENTSFVIADPENTRWLVDNEALANNASFSLAPGRKIRFSARAPGDTLFFPDATAPATLFEDASAFVPMNQCTFSDGVGLTLPSNGTFTELTVKKPTDLLSARFLSAKQCQRMEALAQPLLPVAPFTYPEKFEGAEGSDPYTPLMRAYPGDTVEIRTLVGAHMAPHSFNMHGVKWLFEQDNPNSGFRSTQGMGISEYYHMRFEVPTTNTGADYLYSATSDTKGLEYGQWGLLRAYNAPKAELPQLAPPPPRLAEVCSAAAPAKSSYKVSAVAASQVLPGGKLFYNNRGIQGSSGEGKIFGDGALLYVHDEDLDLTADPIRIKPGKRIEPLVLRAAAGDCIEVRLTNRLPANLSQSRPGSSVAFKNLTLSTSHQVGLHPQQVGMDIRTGNGLNIGKNPASSVAPGEMATLKWYAGSIAPDGTHTPVELGAIGLSPADPLMQHPFGLLGALIIEPAGAIWRTDDNSRSQATVALPSGAQFREFVLVLQDDVEALSLTELTYQPITFSRAGDDRPLLQTTSQSLPPSFSRAVNYRTEPLYYRYNLDPTLGTTDPKLAPFGIARALSNSQVMGDPQTPVLAVSKGTPTRFRVVHPGGLSEQVFTLAGHAWQEQPFQNYSREIGDNAASQWVGARDAFGANDQFNIVLNSAGGRAQVTGDYLYRTFVGGEFQFGIWGVMRVGEPGSDIVTIARAANDKRGWGYAISGVNTVNPNNGKMATEVTIAASVIAPDTKDSKPTLCTVPVHPVSGEWNTEDCPSAVQGTLVVDSGHSIAVTSSERGSALLTGFLPSVPPTPPSAEDIARAIELLRKAGEPESPESAENRKELIQFKGERTPKATVTPAQPARPPRVDPILPNSLGRSQRPSDEGVVMPTTPPAEIHPEH
jgi:hypothetical protein